ncbi:methyltransferase [Streptomyces nanshensis]|uniref:Methyltransferase n=2 Tax=Streptomyces TaxID=1883 RepID=A0A1E7KX43_9ACTN|nr:methyltransferase [Streptomyces nanshensis]
MRMLLYGQLVSRAVSVLVRLGIPELLAERSRGVKELAAATRTHPSALERLLRALVPFGVIAEEGEEGDGARFGLTPLGTTLQPEVSGTAQPTALLLADEVGTAWTRLEHTVRTGESAFRTVYDADLFGYLERNPGLRETFDRSQAAGLTLEVDEIFASITFDRYRHIVDVGGGDGALLCSVLHRTPGSVGTVVDMPGTVPLAQKRIAEADLAHRCSAEVGDFFDRVLPGKDLYILSHILHDWDDRSALRILRTCRAALPENGRIMVIDLVTDGCRAQDDGSESHRLPAVMDLYMLSLFGASGGQERTRSAFAELLAEAGLVEEEAEVLPSGMAVITARRSE